MKATIEDIKRLAVAVKSMSLCGLFRGRKRAAEAETMVAQTIHACVTNHAKRGEAFSFRGDGVFKGGGMGLVDNSTAYGMLIEGAYFVEEDREGRVVIFITQKLVDFLDEYLVKA